MAESKSQRWARTPTTIRLPFGLKNDELVHISQVDTGLACRCVCPQCSTALVARKGNQREHHFAHHASASCQHAVETALHLAAKDILSRERLIRLPVLEVRFKSNRSPHILSPEASYRIDAVRIEQRTGDIVPDLIATIQNHDLLIEVFVTHRVDEAKAQRIRDLELSAVRIDLSGAPRDLPMDALTDLVVNRTDNKGWIHSVRAECEYKRLLSQAHTMPVIRRGLAFHVDYCPISARKWRNKPYANFLDDCSSCDHCLHVGPGNRNILCNGHLHGAG